MTVAISPSANKKERVKTHADRSEKTEVERRGQSTNLDRIEKSNGDFIRFKQLRQSRYVD
jgi:hypothetical protein